MGTGSCRVGAAGARSSSSLTVVVTAFSAADDAEEREAEALDRCGRSEFRSIDVQSVMTGRTVQRLLCGPLRTLRPLR